MLNAPLFSIVTITYNAASTIGATLLSIFQQSCKNYEHIVVDGNSADDTLNIVSNAPGSQSRSVISEPDNGLYDAMNKGLKLAKGQYIIFLNAGDKFHSSNSLSEIEQAIYSNNFPDVVYGQTDLVDINGKYIAPRHLSAPENLTFKDFASGMLVCHQAFVVRRDIAPLYDLKWRFSADYEWCIKCLKASRLNVYTGSITIDYLHEGITTANRKASLIERFKIMSHYYGFWSTSFRHISFIFRFINHKKKIRNAHS